MNDKGSQEADMEFQRVRKKALERDNHTCRFCGFKNNKWQEVHHFNDDHNDNRLENLITTCPFCHMCQHIGLAGARREAILIYRPEITQAQIHHLVRTALVASAHHESLKAEDQTGTTKRSPNLKLAAEADEMGKSLMAALKASADGARQHILTSDPVDLANAMMLMPDDAYARRREFLAGIRLLPLGVRNNGSDNVMTSMVDSWRTGGAPYANLLPNTWKTLISQFS
jgi:intracellular multiplication protein IcmJ